MADNSILIRLDGLKLKYEEIGQKLTDPEVIADVKQFVQLTKEFKELEPIIETSDRFRTALANLAEAKDVLANEKDEEFREIAREEVATLEPAIEKMEEEIKLLLIPKDPQDDKNAIERFVVVLVATRLRFSQVTCSVCTPSISSRRVGATRSPLPPTVLQVVTRRLCSRLQARASTAH